MDPRGTRALRDPCMIKYNRGIISQPCTISNELYYLSFKKNRNTGSSLEPQIPPIFAEQKFLVQSEFILLILTPNSFPVHIFPSEEYLDICYTSGAIYQQWRLAQETGNTTWKAIKQMAAKRRERNITHLQSLLEQRYDMRDG
jgi:hypothetical protein